MSHILYIIENKQNYVILLNKTEHEDRTLRIDLESKKSKLKLKKIDAETKQPLQGVKFDISYADGTKIGSYETNENGEINLENLLKGTIKIVETKTDDMHILESNPIEVDLDYDDEKEIVLENKRIKGKGQKDSGKNVRELLPDVWKLEKSNTNTIGV